MDTDRRSEPLRRSLRGLKDQGCNLLVINDAEGVDAICTRLGGDVRYERRRCYVPVTTTVASVLDRHTPAPRDGATLGIVDATATETIRGTATPIQPGTIDIDAEWYTRLDAPHNLAEIARQIEFHLDRFAELGEAVEPGEVRLCIESLDPFLDPDSDGDDLHRFLESVTELVRKRRAIGHYHIASGADPEILAEIEPCFDATIRVQTIDDGTVQHRWTLQDGTHETDWLELVHQ